LEGRKTFYSKKWTASKRDRFKRKILILPMFGFLSPRRDPAIAVKTNVRELVTGTAIDKSVKLGQIH